MYLTALGLSCSMQGLFPDQVLNLIPICIGGTEPQPLGHQGSPNIHVFLCQ